MRFILIFLFSILLSQVSPVAHAVTPAALTRATADWNRLAGKHVKANGGVDYRGFEADLPLLKAFIDAYKVKGLASMSDKEKTAAWINLYNATMIYNVLRFVSSKKISLTSKEFTDLMINEISIPGGNIWNGDYKVRIGDVPVHLDDIEHGLIRGQADGPAAALKVSRLDPRIHAAVNCAAKSCPPVRNTAYTAANLERMLQENMVTWLNNPEQFKKLDDETLRANQIVFWYYDDFDDHALGLKQGGAGEWLSGFLQKSNKHHAWIKDHLTKHFNDRSRLTLKFSPAFQFYYDWRVNDVRNMK